MANISVEINGVMKPVTQKDFFQMARNGFVGPKTRVEIDGKAMIAEQVDGVRFGQSVSPFDLGFKRFLTPMIVKFIWGCCLIIYPLLLFLYLLYVATCLNAFGAALFMLLLYVPLLVLWLMIIRVMLETVMIIFHISEQLERLNKHE